MKNIIRVSVLFNPSDNVLYQSFEVLLLDCSLARQRPAHLFPTTSGSEKLLKTQNISHWRAARLISRSPYSAIDPHGSHTWRNRRRSMRNFQSGMIGILSAVTQQPGARCSGGGNGLQSSRVRAWERTWSQLRLRLVYSLVIHQKSPSIKWEDAEAPSTKRQPMECDWTIIRREIVL